MVKAENTPLDYIQDNLSQIDPNKSYYVHCAGGYRSVVFASLLKNKGFDNLINVEGGFDAIKKTGKVEVTDYVCPTTML
jgi:hydroxyacylglutathione hydrolase